MQWPPIDFAGAEQAWRAIVAARPDDTAARLMADRAARFAATPPPTDWDGVYEAEK